MPNNYKNRRARGQCAGCTRQSERFYCDKCREKLRVRNREWRVNRDIEKIKKERMVAR